MKSGIAVMLALPILVSSAIGPAEAQRRPDRVLTFDQVLKGNETSKLRWPNAVAAGSEQRVAVADVRDARIFFFKKIGVSWSLEGVAPCPDSPVDIIWSQNRYLVSTRRSGALVAMESASDDPSELPLEAGTRPGALAALDSGDLLIFDQSSASVLRVDGTGKTLGRHPVGTFVTALTSLPRGGWLAAIGQDAEIAVFGANGTIVERWSLPPEGPVPAWPSGLTTDAEGRVFVADQHNGRILVLDATGRWIGIGSRKGWDIGLLLRPAGLARLPNGLLLVADRGNGRAQLFRPTDGS